MHQNSCTNHHYGSHPFRHNSQSSSLIRMKAVLGSPFTAFHPPHKMSEPKSNSALRISSNSSTSSLTMVKFSNADLLVGVKTKSLNVFTTSVRPNSAMKDKNNYDCDLQCYYILSKTLRVTCALPNTTAPNGSNSACSMLALKLSPKE